MADAFRGLTLRIGADTRPLASAIESIKHSAGQAEQQFRAMKKALDVNPANVKALETRLDLAEDKARLTARAARDISVAIRQAKNETVSFNSKAGITGGRMQFVANNVKEIYSATQKLRSGATSVNTELQHIYDAVAKVRAADDGISFEKALVQVKNLAKQMDGVGKSAWEAQRQFKALLSSAVTGYGTTATTDIRERFGLKATITDSRILYKTFQNLRAESRAFDHDLKEMNKVEGFRAMQTQLVAYRSELNRAASDLVRFRTEL